MTMPISHCLSTLPREILKYRRGLPTYRLKTWRDTSSASQGWLWLIIHRSNHQKKSSWLNHSRRTARKREEIKKWRMLVKRGLQNRRLRKMIITIISCKWKKWTWITTFLIINNKRQNYSKYSQNSRKKTKKKIIQMKI